MRPGERHCDALDPAGATGLEPATPGFGDRCATNCATPLGCEGQCTPTPLVTLCHEMQRYALAGLFSAIAVSLVTREDSGRHFDTAAHAVLMLMRRLIVDPLPADTILNVNVPDLPWERVRGFEVTRLGKRHRSAPAVRALDPRGREMWWIGPPGEIDDDGPGTDFDAVRRGYVSVTPIHTDLTRAQALEKVSGWMAPLSAAMDGEEAA